MSRRWDTAGHRRLCRHAALWPNVLPRGGINTPPSPSCACCSFAALTQLSHSPVEAPLVQERHPFGNGGGAVCGLDSIGKQVGVLRPRLIHAPASQSVKRGFAAAVLTSIWRPLAGATAVPCEHLAGCWQMHGTKAGPSIRTMQLTSLISASSNSPVTTTSSPAADGNQDLQVWVDLLQCHGFLVQRDGRWVSGVWNIVVFHRLQRKVWSGHVARGWGRSGE